MDDVADYDDDIIAWSERQAALLRALAGTVQGLPNDLDLLNIAEEIEDVGKSEQRELATRMAVLLVHLLKWQYQPERRGASWESVIHEQRRALTRRLQKTPSLQSCTNDPDWWEDAWLDARTDTTKETGIDFNNFPTACPWTISELLDDHWLPG